jgi:hypothetical protein
MNSSPALSTAHRSLLYGRIALAASGWIVLALTALPLGSPERMAAASLFLLWCPGAALVRHWPGSDGMERTVLATAVSMSADMLVAEALIVAHFWSATLALAALSTITTVAALVPAAPRGEGHGRA